MPRHTDVPVRQRLLIATLLHMPKGEWKTLCYKMGATLARHEPPRLPKVLQPYALFLETQEDWYVLHMHVNKLRKTEETKAAREKKARDTFKRRIYMRKYMRDYRTRIRP